MAFQFPPSPPPSLWFSRVVQYKLEAGDRRRNIEEKGMIGCGRGERFRKEETAGGWKGWYIFAPNDDGHPIPSVEGGKNNWIFTLKVHARVYYTRRNDRPEPRAYVCMGYHIFVIDIHQSSPYYIARQGGKGGFKSPVAHIRSLLLLPVTENMHISVVFY